MTEQFNFDELDELYREVILDHYRRPKNRTKLDDPDIEAKGFNPFCGDEVVIQMSLDDQGRVREIAHQGQGCSISQASASMMTNLLKGKSLEESVHLSELFRLLMRGEEISDDDLEAMGDLEALQGVRKFPIRIKCALLAWAALDDGLQEHRQRADKS